MTGTCGACLTMWGTGAGSGWRRRGQRLGGGLLRGGFLGHSEGMGEGMVCVVIFSSVGEANSFVRVCSWRDLKVDTEARRR